MSNTKKKIKVIVILLIVEILLAAGFFGYKYAMSEYRTMKQYGNELKAEAKRAYNEIKAFNLAGAEEKMYEIKETCGIIRERLEQPFWKYASYIPYAKTKIDAVVTVLDVIDEGIEEIGEPGFQLVKDYPFDEFKVGDGFNAAIIRAYIDFADKAEPKAQELLSKVLSVDLSFADKEGKIQKYKEKADVIFELFNSVKADLNVAKTIIGTEDRYYIFAAQNSAEIRAAGGFVGSVGTIVIKDGVIYIGDFKSVYNVMEQDTPSSGNITAIENKLFGGKLSIAHDSEYDPDFRRVAEIWTSAYEPYNNVEVDGVISMTPVLIQRMLKITGSEMTLSDGTVLNGENATRVIEYDIYHKYFNIYSFTLYLRKQRKEL